MVINTIQLKVVYNEMSDVGFYSRKTDLLFVVYTEMDGAGSSLVSVPNCP